MDANHRIDIRRDLVALLPKIRRFALTLLRDPARVDAIVIQACEQAIQKSHMWKGDTRLEVRLFAAVRSLVRAEPVKRRPSETLRVTAQRYTGQVGNGRALIDLLSEECASVFLLCAVEKLSYREAAAVMGGTPDAIATTMVAARCELAQLAVETTERRA
ncbi:RNA polymerase sigma factor [Rhizobium sp. SAFR-030]|uniref:RNA polymerase sigma factor n=1 Tax=Rhizobium sp. SAFR-030 TaxID=3387277 RepID=UPI003F7D859E